MKGTNPINKFKYGKYTKCRICQSIFHWANDCPHKNEHIKLVNDNSDNDQQNIEDCNIILFTHSKPSENKIFEVETEQCAVIDTACTRTVCGEKWLSNYLDKLTEDKKKGVTETVSGKNFRFGDGKIVKSFKLVKLPAKIGVKKCHIEVEVVKSDIPLLLSKFSLKKAGTILNLHNDKAVMFGRSIDLQFTSSGHYCIDILDKSDDLCKPGDKVYYKRPDNDEWKGPAAVIGQDGPVVFLKHGGSHIRVHKCRLSNSHDQRHDQHRKYNCRKSNK